MEHLEDKATADGINVPTFVNDGGANGNWISGKGAADMDGVDSYPQGFDCANPANVEGPARLQLTQPVPETRRCSIAEFQGGALRPLGRHRLRQVRQLTGDRFTACSTR